MQHKMIIENREGHTFTVSNIIPISIEQNFNKKQANAFSQPYAAKLSLVDLDQNGIDQAEPTGCRCDSITFIPHCNGTHTEGLGHVSKENIGINKLLNHNILKAILITVSPASLSDDFIIDKKSIENSIYSVSKNIKGTDALIVRCFDDRIIEGFPYINHNNPPYFSNEAILFISKHFKHLLTDLPSIDKQKDEGALANHLTFFHLPKSRDIKDIFVPDSTEIKEEYKRTITELCYLPHTIKNGAYFLQIQCLNWDLDAAPSNPVLYEYT